jgi:hypothetical protein
MSRHPPNNFKEERIGNRVRFAPSALLTRRFSRHGGFAGGMLGSKERNAQR